MTKLKHNSSKTILTIVGGLLIIHLLTQIKLWLTIALVLAIIGILSNYLSQKIEFLWKKLSWILSLIIPNILLGLLFYLFLFPIALISKLFGQKDPLFLKNGRPSTYRVRKQTGFGKESFEKMW